MLNLSHMAFFLTVLNISACSQAGGFVGGVNKSKSTKAPDVRETQILSAAATGIRRFSEEDLQQQVEAFRAADAAQGGALWKKVAEKSPNDFFADLLQDADNDPIEIFGVVISGRRDFLLAVEPQFDRLSREFSGLGELYATLGLSTIEEVTYNSVKDGLANTANFISEGMPLFESEDSNNVATSSTFIAENLALAENPPGTTTSTLPRWVCNGVTAGAQAVATAGCAGAAGVAGAPTAGVGGAAVGAACTAGVHAGMDDMKKSCTKPLTVYPPACQHNPFACHDANGKLPGQEGYDYQPPAQG